MAEGFPDPLVDDEAFMKKMLIVGILHGLGRYVTRGR